MFDVEEDAAPSARDHAASERCPEALPHNTGRSI